MRRRTEFLFAPDWRVSGVPAMQERDGTGDARQPVVKLRKKILLIDHEPHVTRRLREALENAGCYSIREEHDTTFALHTIRWFQPDLVMIDLTGAATDGEILARQLQRDEELRKTPLLCLSTFLSEREFLSAGILSGYSFLAGPFKIDSLIRAVEQLVFNKD